MAIRPYAAHPQGLTLNIHLTPGARRTGLDRIEPDGEGICRLRVSVAAVPEKGKANAALATLIGKKLRLPKSSIQIIAGQQSRRKRLLLAGETPALAERVEALLREEKLTGS